MTGTTGKNASKALILLAGLGLALMGCESEPEVMEPEQPTEGQVVISVSPEGLDAPWTLELPTGQLVTGIGDRSLSGMPTGSYQLVWGPVDGMASPTPNPASEVLSVRGLIRFENTYSVIEDPTGTITIDPNPDSLSATWYIAGPNGFVATGQGDAVLPGREVGEYILTWAPIPGYFTPTPNPQIFTIVADQTANRTGVYTEDPGQTGTPTGTILIVTAPAGVEFPWALSGPDGFNRSGTGGARFDDVEVGEYTVTWNDLSGWTTPSPRTESHMLADNETKDFFGSYGNPNAPTISSVSGSSTNGASIVLGGSDLGSHTLELTAGSGPNGWIESNSAGTDFDNLSNAPGWDVGLSSGAKPTITTAQAHSGNKSCLSYVGPVPGGLSWQSVLRYRHSQRFDEIYATWWIYRDPISWGSFAQWKLWRVNDYGGVSDNCSDVYQTSYWAGNGNPTDFQTAFHCNVGCQDWNACYENIVPEPFYPPKNGIKANYRVHNHGGTEPYSVNLPAERQWTRIEIHLESSDLDTYNGRYSLSINKPGQRKKVIDTLRGLLTHKSSCCRDQTEPWQWFMLQNLFGDNGGAFIGERADFFFDDIYVQFGTQARVELGDQPDYAACTKLEIQEPTSWSSDSVRINLNHGSFSSGQTAYLFVVRDDGVASAGRQIELQ